MSLSNLGAQLASLHGAKTGGSIVPSSRRQEDSVGRGLHYSARRGHVITHSAHSSDRASVLFDSSKEASDISLVDLREACAAAMEKLELLTDDQTHGLASLANEASLKFERNLATKQENLEVDEKIARLLRRLVVLLHHAYDDCLYVLEYLLRRYQIHSRARTSEELLLTAIPHHETPLFSRILQLLDLTSVGGRQTFVFLRPFSVTATSESPVPRSVLSKRASQDDVLLAMMASLAQNAQEAFASSTQSADQNSSASRVFSFAAALAIEALDFQWTSAGTIREASLRCLLPKILHACQSSHSKHHQDYLTFGHILACHLARRCTLAPQTREVFANAILENIQNSDDDDIDNDDDDTPSAEAIERASDSLLALLSVSHKESAGGGAASHDSSDFLPFPREIRREPMQQNADDPDWRSCPLAESTFLTLTTKIRPKLLAIALQHLQTTTQVQVLPLVSSLVAMSLRFSSPTQETPTELMVQLSTQDAIFASSHLTEATVVCLLESAVKAIGATDGDDDAVSHRKKITKTCRRILDALSKANSRGRDRGVTIAVHRMKKLLHKKKKQRKFLEKLLKNSDKDLDTLMDTDLEKESTDDAQDGKDDDDDDAMLDELLPPMVAIEHSNSSLRLGAIQKLLADAQKQTGALNQVKHFEPREGDELLSLCEALLRRVASDDDGQVVVAAASALGQLGAESILADVTFAQGVLKAVYRWISDRSFSSVDTDNLRRKKLSDKSSGADESPSIPPETLSCLSSTLALGSLAARALIEKKMESSNAMEIDDENEETADEWSTSVLHNLLEAMASLFDLENASSDVFEDVILSASKAICHALQPQHEDSKENGLHDARTKAMMLMWTHEWGISTVRRSCLEPLPSDEDEGAAVIHRTRIQFLWWCMASYPDMRTLQKSHPPIPPMNKSHQPDGNWNFLLIASSHILELSSSSVGMGKVVTKRSSALLSCLSACANEVSTRFRDHVPDALIRMASVNAKSTIQDEIVVPFLETVLQGAINVKIPRKKKKGGSLASGRSAVTVLMEVSSRPDIPLEALKLCLRLATKILEAETKLESQSLRQAIIPLLALMRHTDGGIREAALKIAACCAAGASQADPTTALLSELLSFASKTSSANSSSLLMDGATSFTTFLADAMANSSDSAGLRKELFERCSDSAGALRGSSSFGDDPTEGEWLPPGAASGFATAAASVLDAMALVGEQCFPLKMRWEIVGKSILSTILSLDDAASSHSKAVLMSPAMHNLLASSLSMLKGVTADSTQAANDMIITIGPDGAGGRSRSYSIGNAEGLSLLSPYPEDMIATISELLSPLTDSMALRDAARKTVISLVVSRPSWAGARGIYPNLPRARRIEIARNLIVLRSQLGDEAAGKALMGLHLICEDLSAMLERAASDDTMNGTLEVIFICDSIRFRAAGLSREKEVFKLLHCLFNCIPRSDDVATEKLFQDEHAELSIIQSIRSLLVQIEGNRDSGKMVKGGTMSFGAQSSQLVALLGTHPSDKESGRSLRTEVILDSLRCLCVVDSSSVKSLLPALEQVIRRNGVTSEADENGEHQHSVGVRHSILAVVPAYCSNARASQLLFGELLLTIIRALREGSSERTCDIAKIAVVDAVVLIPNRNVDGNAVASTIAAFAAEEARITASSQRKRTEWDEYLMEGEKEPRWLAVSMDMLLRIEPREQLVSCLTLTRITLALAKSSESDLKTETSSTTRSDKNGGSDFMADSNLLLAILSAETFHEEMAVEDQNVVEGMNWTVALLSSILRSWLLGKGAKKTIRKSDDDTQPSLEFWQELMHLHSVLIQKKTDDLFAVELAHSATRDGLDILQWSLPEPEFLAALSGLLQDRHLADTILVRALQALFDRAAATKPFSPQARLFVEVIPDLVSMVSGLVGKGSMLAGEQLTRGSVLVAQKALTAISGLTRTLCTATDSTAWTTETSPSLRSTLEQIIAILSDTKAKMEPSLERRDLSLFLQTEFQMLNSGAQCTSALISALKTQSIQYLPRLVPLLAATITAVNRALGDWTDSDDDHPQYQAAKQCQLCLLRGVGAIVEELPQFLGQYLGVLFGTDCLVSSSLRKTGNDADLMVNEASENLDNMLGTRTPARHLLPSACGAITSRLQGEGEPVWTEISVLLRIIMTCIKTWPRADLSSVMGKVFTTLLAVYDGRISVDSRDKLLDVSNEVFLSMVMKISETQLRPLYLRLKDWKGDDLSSWTRRQAFWKLSATLSSHLRSLFLPCFTGAVTDAVAELELAVSILCSPTSSKASTAGQKKRRVDEASAASPNSLKPLLPLLRCLETCLRADAHSGGGWIRGDDAQRYRTLLEPLGRLLQAKISVSSLAALGLTRDGYVRVVHGSGIDDASAGNVVSCLTALATAAGNEQLWKPLNLALVESCGHRGRSEVRKAAVKCLSQILVNVGEEYMVLLPECLPVLSELLEDDDEDISSLARECIRQGEELLGESLEDNLV